MTLFHINQQENSGDQAAAPAHPAAGAGKKCMSLFSFGLSSSTPPAKCAVPALSTSPNSRSSATRQSRSPSTTSPTGSLPSKNNQLSSPVCSPLLETDSLTEMPETSIFERSVQDCSEVKQEDYIPPALDATAQILSDKDTNLDDVEMVYSSRRNSSVIGLNMALGRPYTPLRKNSVYSMSQMNQNGHGASLTSLSNQPQSPVSPPKLSSSRSSVSFYSYADMINNDEFSRRPSIMHSYSHGVVPTIGRKMSVASNHSTTSNSGAPAPNPLHFNKLSRKLTLNSIASGQSQNQSQLSKQLACKCPNSSGVPQRSPSKVGERETRNLNKFLISPESSDSEDQEVYYPATSSSSISKRKSISSTHSNLDNQSLISTSVGDCIRQCTTEISGH